MNWIKYIPVCWLYCRITPSRQTPSPGSTSTRIVFPTWKPPGFPSAKGCGRRGCPAVAAADEEDRGGTGSAVPVETAAPSPPSVPAAVPEVGKRSSIRPPNFSSGNSLWY